MNIKRILRSVVFFEYVTEHHVQQLVDLARSQTVETGEVVFSEGEAENHLYLIESGRIQISREGPHFGRQAFALLGPGDHFGALSLFYADPHFASATAVETTRLWMIRHDDFQACLQKQPKLAFAVLKGIRHDGARHPHRERRDPKADDTFRSTISLGDRATRKKRFNSPIAAARSTGNLIRRDGRLQSRHQSNTDAGRP